MKISEGRDRACPSVFMSDEIDGGDFLNEYGEFECDGCGELIPSIDMISTDDGRFLCMNCEFEEMALRG